jgi:Tfp pilus assembly protein PilO
MAEKEAQTQNLVGVLKGSSQKNQGYIFTAITVVVAVILIVFAIRPTITTIIRINNEISEKKELNTSLDNKINALSQLDKQYTTSKDDFNNLKLLYPADNDFSLVLANIQPILARDSFSLSGISFDEYQNEDFTVTTKVLEPYSLKLSVVGSPANIVNLLKDLESLPMSPVIESLSYSDQKDSNGSTIFSVELRVYKIDNVNFYD